MEQISPTRMNLLTKRGQIKLARQGASLLSRKKDALQREFFSMVGEMYKLRSRLNENIRRETIEAVIAEGIQGRHVLASAAVASGVEFQATLRERNLWGVRVIDLEHTYRERDSYSRPYSPGSAELTVNEIAEGFERIVRDMLDLAPLELRLRRIGEDIKKTNRKVKALEQQLIPRLESQARYIAQVLEERARDDVFRLKHLKRKKESSKREIG